MSSDIFFRCKRSMVLLFLNCLVLALNLPASQSEQAEPSSTAPSKPQQSDAKVEPSHVGGMRRSSSVSLIPLLALLAASTQIHQPNTAQSVAVAPALRGLQ